MVRDFEKDMIELDAAIKSNTERDNTFTLSVLQRAKAIILQQKEKLKAYEDTGLEPEEILALKRRERWVPVQERLPNEGQEVLASNGRYEYLEEYDSNYKFMDGMIAWMPLPEHFKP